MADEDDFLMGGGGVSAKFEPGTVVKGKILSKQLRQQTDFKTKEPMFWADGRPRNQLVVALQTDEIDDEIEDDDGVRNVYIRFKMREAVAAAVKKAGAKTLDIGGELAIKCTGAEKPKTRGAQGAKLYKARYTPPDPADFLNEDEEDLGDEDEAPPPPRKAAAKKAPARKAAAKKAPARKAAVDEFADDDDSGDDEDDPGF